jgi:hypothetical protein
LDGANAAAAHRDNDIWIEQLRRNLPVLRIFAESYYIGEAEAAYSQLRSAAATVNDALGTSVPKHGTKISPASLYYGATTSDRWQIADLRPPEFREEVYEELVERDCVGLFGNDPETVEYQAEQQRARNVARTARLKHGT